MKKVVRLTEADLVRIVKRVIKEQTAPQETTNVPLIGNVPNYQREQRLSQNLNKTVSLGASGSNPDDLNARFKKFIKNQQYLKGFPNIVVNSVSIKDSGNGLELAINATYTNPNTSGYNFLSIVFNPKGQPQQAKNNSLSKNVGSKVLKTGNFNFQNQEYEYHLIGIPLEFK
jgi:hypothetical protein